MMKPSRLLDVLSIIVTTLSVATTVVMQPHVPVSIDPGHYLTASTALCFFLAGGFVATVAMLVMMWKK